MKLSERHQRVARWLSRIWEMLVAPARIGHARERRLSRALNVMLLLLLVWGSAAAIQYRLERGTGNKLVPVMLGLLILLYSLNRKGYFMPAAAATIGLLVTAALVSAWMQYSKGSGNPLVLYYLIIPILMAELFFSLRGYFISAAAILLGVFGISLLNPDAQVIFGFLFVFCALIAFSSYNRRVIEREQAGLAGQFARERSLRSLEQRRAAQLGLLEEVGRRITDSLNEQEILERTLEVAVDRFGYAEAAISVLVDDDTLEVAAITGTEDFGYRAGYRQKVGQGIIGHVAKTRRPHIAGDVSKDPYYYSTAERKGSAIGVPLLAEEKLLGVIYVESSAQNDLNLDDVQALQALASQVATSIQKARLYTRTQEHLRVMTTLQSVSHVITSSLELNEILRNVIEILRDAFGYTHVSVYLLDGEVLRLGAQLGYPDEMIIHEIPATGGVIGRAARTRQTQFVRDVNQDPDFLRASDEVKSEICVPLLKDDEVLGVLNVESGSAEPLDEDDVDLLNALGGPVAVAIDNARLHAEVKRMALTDVISGLANRRAFDDLLQAEILRARRYDQPLSLIILDLDSFKEYNDRWGHPAGDQRLRQVAEILRANVREPDLAARYGGEEFAVILPNTSKAGAVALAERLRAAAENHAPARHLNGSPISGYTISLGVATFPEDASTLEELLLAADNAELAAKRLGKNRVCAAPASKPQDGRVF